MEENKNGATDAYISVYVFKSYCILKFKLTVNQYLIYININIYLYSSVSVT